MSSILLILSTFAAPPTAAAAPADQGSALLAGDVFVCDFEDANDANYDGWPDGWTRRRSRDLPEYLRVDIVAEDGSVGSAHQPDSQAVGTAHPTTNHCLQIELDGGGAAVCSPHFPVSAQFSLVLNLRLKTAGLTHDGAWATLELFDAEGNVLESHASQPLTAAKAWQSLRIGPLEPGSNKVVRGIVSLHLAPLGKREDLTGRAWFDDLRVARLPRMILAASTRTGVYPGTSTAELFCEVSGIRATNPQVRFELFDHTGERLADHTEPLLAADELAKSAAPADGFAGHLNWNPPLPDFGFYRVRASLLAEDTAEPLLGRTQTLAMLRPLPPPARSAFGWTLPSDDPPYKFSQLALLLSQAGVGWAKMPVWYDPKDSARADRIAAFAEQLSIQGIELVGVLDQPPPELREMFREQGQLPVATVFAEPELWRPMVGPAMTRLSLKVHWWQLGDDNDVSFIGYPHLDDKIAEIKKNLSQFGQQIHLGINWRFLYAPPQSADKGGPPWACLSYNVDPPLTADELAAYLPHVGWDQRARLAPAHRPAINGGPALAETSLSHPTPGGRRIAPGPQRWLLLSPLPQAEYSKDVRVRDLVQRMLAAKMQAADAIFLPQPLDDDLGVMNADSTPGELFVPWRTTAALVGGAEYLGSVPLQGGSTGHLFAQGGRAVMAVWSDRPMLEHVMLGDDIDQIDVWGRAIYGKKSKPPLVEHNGRQQHELRLTPMPTFVIGLSESVARWQAAANFESTQLSSVAGKVQTLILRIPNTFPQGVNGELTLHAPKSWDVDPRPTRFKLSEGEVLRLPLPVTLMADASSGPQPVRLDFEIQGTHRFSIYRTLQLGLDDVQVELTTSLRKDGALVVEEHLTNISNRPLSFHCLLFAPGRRRETRQVINLSRDRTTIIFVLPRGEELIGQKLWLRVEEIGGSRVLNYTPTADR